MESSLQQTFIENSYQAASYHGASVIGFAKLSILRPTRLVVQFVGRPTRFRQGVSLGVVGAKTEFSDKYVSNYTIWHRKTDERITIDIVTLKRTGDSFVTACNMWYADGLVSYLVGDAHMQPEVRTRDGELWIRFECTHGFGKTRGRSLVFELKVGDDLLITFPEYLTRLASPQVRKQDPPVEEKSIGTKIFAYPIALALLGRKEDAASYVQGIVKQKSQLLGETEKLYLEFADRFSKAT